MESRWVPGFGVRHTCLLALLWPCASHVIPWSCCFLICKKRRQHTLSWLTLWSPCPAQSVAKSICSTNICQINAVPFNCWPTTYYLHASNLTLLKNIPGLPRVSPSPGPSQPPSALSTPSPPQGDMQKHGLCICCSLCQACSSSCLVYHPLYGS